MFVYIICRVTATKTTILLHKVINIMIKCEFIWNFEAVVQL